MPFYPGEEGSLSYNTNISLDGSTPHIKEITFAGKSNNTYAGGDVVQVQNRRIEIIDCFRPRASQLSMALLVADNVVISWSQC